MRKSSRRCAASSSTADGAISTAFTTARGSCRSASRSTASRTSTRSSTARIPASITGWTGACLSCTARSADAFASSLEGLRDGQHVDRVRIDRQRIARDLAILLEHVARLLVRILDRARRAARERRAEARRVAGHDSDLEAAVFQMPRERVVDVVERDALHHASKALEMTFALEAVEAVVHRVAEAPRRRLGVVQHVLRKERAGELEVLAPHAVPHEPIELPRGRAQREMGLLVRQRANPDLEDLMTARHVNRGHLPVAAFRERLDVRVVAVIESADLADHLEQAARRLAMLAEPRDRERERVVVRIAAPHVDRKTQADRRVRAGLVDQE